MKIKDNIQLFQSIILSTILFVGVFFYGLDISILEIWVVFIFVIGLDFVFQNFVKHVWSQKIIFPFSWVNAAFGICFFLRSEDIWVYVLAAIIAILSKYLLTIRWKHFLNPSNAAVCMILLIFPQFTWVNTLQWWNYTWEITYLYIIAVLWVIWLWIFMMLQVRRIVHYSYLYDYILPFLLLHFALFFIIPYYEPWSSFFLFFNVSFFIFTFFMMTDPKTVPHTSLWRIFFAASLVLTFYLLQFHINESYAILFSLFYNTILLPVIWNLEEKPNYLVFLYVMYYSVIVGLIIYYINIYWAPDLVFDNICNQMICK